ncbi:MAG TPA: metallophosphoesterase, partial [Trueperaceae bacterium]|nr:metallophosphoesterase [Trueperaceae bacterium]
MRIVVIGDIHVQPDKLWRMLREAGLADEHNRPTDALRAADTKLVLLGDLVHAKSRQRYADLINVRRYDEYNPRHLERAEAVQERFLREVKGFQDRVPAGNMVILLGNHDFNAATPEQGPLRTDDVSHLEWKPGYGADLDQELRDWILSWP